MIGVITSETYIMSTIKNIKWFDDIVLFQHSGIGLLNSLSTYKNKHNDNEIYIVFTCPADRKLSLPLWL